MSKLVMGDVVQPPAPRVRVDAIRALGEAWVADSAPGSDRHDCGTSLLGVLAAAIDEPRSAVAVGSEQR